MMGKLLPEQDGDAKLDLPIAELAQCIDVAAAPDDAVRWLVLLATLHDSAIVTGAPQGSKADLAGLPGRHVRVGGGS
jgi:hypothetical protein